MFGKVIQAGVSMGAIQRVRDKMAQTNTQSQLQKKKKKSATRRSSVSARRGNAGKRSLLNRM
tara:strand:- start:364 stop:549 length:186 start_codon:yes stop_codon:yes gene_type:complete